MESDVKPVTLPRELIFQPLGPNHRVDDFRCGKQDLDAFLTRYAAAHPRQGLSKTWVMVDETGKVLGYYTLAPGAMTRAQTTPRMAKGMPAYNIPVILLGRFAIRTEYQGLGLGREMLKNQLLRAARMMTSGADPDTDALPFRALVVEAIDSAAAGFYERYGFEPSPINANTLMIVAKDLVRALRQDPEGGGRLAGPLY